MAPAEKRPAIGRRVPRTEPRPAIGKRGARAEPEPAIGDYAVLGDGRSAALVSRHGSIDWLCWPRFDSPAVFAALLDPERGGRWQLCPTPPFRASRSYLPGTNVLETRFETATGEVQLVDFMAVAAEEEKKQALLAEHALIRTLHCLRGEVQLQLRYEPRPDFARRSRLLSGTQGLGIRLEDGSHLYTLQADGLGPGETLEVDPTGVHATLQLSAGDRRTFVLGFDSGTPATLVVPHAYAATALEQTVRWWRGWSSSSTYRGPYREAVTRSLLTLKLLSYAPSGAIVAAPTTSLPERIGGALNWDYRFCWLRDAALTVRVLFDLGYQDDAEAFVGWLLHSTRLTRPQLRVLYDVFGGLPGEEEELSHLAGYRGSRPVRLQNGAAAQLQLDTYGEVIDAVAQMVRRGVRLDRETQRMVAAFGRFVCENWQRPDQGIWEPRGAPRHYTHSKLMCWTALDRCIELHQLGELRKLPLERFEKNRALLRDQLEQRAWNPGLNSYTQVLDGVTVDASLLLMSWHGFEPARSPRMRATGRRIWERLEVAPGLLYRNEESVPAGEGAFGICSFWGAEFLARGAGSLDSAEDCFEHLLGCANDLGLYAEEFDPADGAALGNFPQAFTHVGLISAALAIEERRAEQSASRTRHPQDTRQEAHP